MEILVPGIEYALHSSSGEELIIRFISKTNGEIVHGFTSEEFLEMLSDRLRKQNNDSFSSRTGSALSKIDGALNDLRTRRMFKMQAKNKFVQQNKQ